MIPHGDGNRIGAFVVVVLWGDRSGEANVVHPAILPAYIRFFARASTIFATLKNPRFHWVS
jgi:hypothetical protein